MGTRDAIRGILLALGLTCTTWLAACEDKPFEEPMQLGGETIAADTLNKGHQLYRRHCIACHGHDGNGDGANAGRMDPSPRDFTAGQFKFKSTPGDALPVDTDLRTTIRRGLKGTYMNGFSGFDEEELEALAHYLKTFSGRWSKEVPPAPVAVPEDPWEGRRTEAIARGEVVYHAVVKCWQCHPAQRGRSEIEEMMGREKTTLGEVEWRANLHQPERVDTAYGKLLPMDFSDATFRAARTNNELYVRLGAGIGGTKMPALSGQIPSDDIWATVHYVRELQRVGALQRRE